MKIYGAMSCFSFKMSVRHTLYSAHTYFLHVFETNNLVKINPNLEKKDNLCDAIKIYGVKSCIPLKMSARHNLYSVHTYFLFQMNNLVKIDPNLEKKR